MSDQPKPMSADFAYHLVDQADLVLRAIEGLIAKAQSCEIQPRQFDGVLHGATMLHDRAEDLAAALGGRETRWPTRRPERGEVREPEE
jgi:hypothetical protein